MASNLPDGLPDWIAQQLGCGLEQIALDMVAGDASPRRYYRVTYSADRFSGERLGGLPAGASCIAMVSPASENNEAFLCVGAKLTEFDVRTPKVWAENGAKGWFLLCLLYTSPSPRDLSTSRMPSSA